MRYSAQIGICVPLEASELRHTIHMAAPTTSQIKYKLYLISINLSGGALGYGP